MHIMRSLTEFICEWKQDMMPKCVVIMGGPGAGKTYWMTDHNENGKPSWMTQGEYKKLFGETNVSRRLDMDHNLVQVQIENLKNIAKFLLTGIKQGADKEWFKKFIAAKQEQMDEACKKGGSKKVDLSKIKLDFVKEWVVKYDEAKNKETVMKEFYKAFKNEYWKAIFASDFSRRAESKRAYKETYYNKFKGLVDKEDDDEFSEDMFTTYDICLAICGDEIEKFEQIKDYSNGRHAIYVIYLDIPTDMSIEADKNRDRTVGEKMVREKLEGVHKTWEELKDRYDKDLGIWKMVHYVTPEGKHPNWQLKEMFINKNMIKADK